MLHIEIIVEAILNRGSDCELHTALWIETLHCLRHNVRASMTQSKPSARILKGQYLKGSILRYGRCQINNLPVEARCQCLFGQRIAHPLDDIQQRRPRLCLANGAIRQCQLYHRTLSSQS